MDFIKDTTWQDEPNETTPILAADIIRWENGIEEGARDATEAAGGNARLASTGDMAAGTSTTRVATVKRVVDYVAAALAGLPGLSAATTELAGAVELATQTEMNAATDTARVPPVARVATYVTAAVAALNTTLSATIASLSSATTTALSNKADKTGSWQVFADVADTAYTEGDAPVFSSGSLQPVDLSLNFAGLGGDLRLDPDYNPLWFIPQVIIEEGSVPPGTFPAYGLVGKLPAAASLIPTLLDVDSVRAANNVVLQLPEDVLAGEYIGFSLGWSNETPFDHFSAAFGGTGPGSGSFNFGTLSIPNTTSGDTNGFVKVTADASAGSTITFTCRDAANAAINRVHMIASIYRLPNLIADAATVRDQQAVGGGGSSSTLTAVGAAISTTTAQPSEVVIGSATISAGTTPNLRDIAGTSDWETLVNHLSDNGSSGRRLYVGYKVLSGPATPVLTTQVSLSGTATQTGAWAAKIVSYKGI